jgi:rhomboid protease GluP
MAEVAPQFNEVARTRHGRVAREYALVLEAVGVPCEVVALGPEHVIAAAPPDVERARTELREYDEENRGWRRTEELPLALENGWIASAAWIFTLMAMHSLSGARALASDWYRQGRGDSSLILGSEPWRAITALGLHADAVHLLGNTLLGALLLALVAEVLGVGVGLLAVLVAGGLANVLNSGVQDHGFRFIGASTAVFAALGLLGGHRWQRRKTVRRNRSAAWIPLFASAFLLGFLGSGSSPDFDPARVGRVDVVGHVSGFVVGIAVGALFAKRLGVRRLSLRAQWWCGAAAAALWFGAWTLALN